MKLTKIISRCLAISVVCMAMAVNAFALSAQQIEAIMEVDQTNNLVCAQHPELTSMLVKGQSQSAGDIECKIKQPGGTITYYVPSANIKAVEVILTQSDQTISQDSAGSKTDAQNILQEIQDKNAIAPNYNDAAIILQPFVPYINIGLGFVTTVVVLAMQVLTALDLCFVAIPTFRNFLSDKAAEGNSLAGKKDGNGGMKLRFIQDEAQYAVEQATNNPGMQPWGLYLKTRVVSYIFLAVAMVILLTGNVTLITDLAVKAVSGLMNVISGLV